MNAHDVYLDWVYLANKGHTHAKFKLLSQGELRRLKSYESKYIQNAKIEQDDVELKIRLL